MTKVYSQSEKIYRRHYFNDLFYALARKDFDQKSADGILKIGPWEEQECFQLVSICSIHQNIPFLQKLKEMGVSMNALNEDKTEWGWKPFLGFYEKDLKEALNCGLDFNLNIQDNRGRGVFYHGLISPEETKLFIEYGADVNLINPTNQLPAMVDFFLDPPRTYHEISQSSLFLESLNLILDQNPILYPFCEKIKFKKMLNSLENTELKERLNSLIEKQKMQHKLVEPITQLAKKKKMI